MTYALIDLKTGRLVALYGHPEAAKKNCLPGMEVRPLKLSTFKRGVRS